MLLHLGKYGIIINKSNPDEKPKYFKGFSKQDGSITHTENESNAFRLIYEDSCIKVMNILKRFEFTDSDLAYTEFPNC